MKVLRTVDNMWDSAIARIILREIWERGNFESCCMSMYCELVLRARHIRAGFDKFCPEPLLHITLSKIKMNEKNPIPIRLPSSQSLQFYWQNLGLNTCEDTLNSKSLQNSFVLSTCVLASSSPACMCAGGVSYHNKAAEYDGQVETRTQFEDFG